MPKGKSGATRRSAIPSPRRPADPTSPILPDISSALQDAARRVAEQVAEQTGEPIGASDVQRRLGLLVQALQAEMSSRDPGPAPSPELERSQHLLELLYREVIGGWSSQSAAPSSAEMLHLLRSFERVRGAVSPRLSDQLFPFSASSSATDLLVEFAHDLRSPLTSVIFLAETLRNGQVGDVNPLQRRQLGIIYSAALSLVSMASDVIDLARGGLRLMDRRPTPFSVAELLESTQDILHPVAEEKGLALRVVAPEADERLGHPVAVSRVLLNLATNALKFTERGSVEIAARDHGDGRVEFSVSDTGPGLDEETRSRLFEPLRRNPQSHRFGFSGSGLGLTICHRLVGAMGGELLVESRPGRGTRFFFVLELPAAPTA